MINNGLLKFLDFEKQSTSAKVFLRVLDVQALLIDWTACLIRFIHGVGALRAVITTCVKTALREGLILSTALQ